MNLDEVNWLLQTIEDPENAKRFVQAQYQRGRIPYHVMACLARERNWTNWPVVEKPAALISMECVTTAKDSTCNGALTGTEVTEARDFSTKAKERDFAAEAKHGDSIAFRRAERCTKSLASEKLGYGFAPDGASTADLVQSVQGKTGPASQKGRAA